MNADVAMIARVSVSGTGAEANGASAGLSPVSSLSLGRARISSNGKQIAFSSDATNLVTADANNVADVFIHDRQARTTKVLSLTNNAALPNAASYAPAFSSDGNYGAFFSAATNLMPGTNPGCYYRDLQTTTLTRLTTSQSCIVHHLSSTGRFVLFTEANGSGTNFRGYDRTLGSTRTFHTIGFQNDISGTDDGRWATFTSVSALDGTDTNSKGDLYLIDLDSVALVTSRVSLSKTGAQLGNGAIHGAISKDGAYMTFTTADAVTTDDTNAGLDVYLVNRATGPTSAILVSTRGIAGDAGQSQLSAEGRYVVFEFKPTGQPWQVWIHDRVSSTTTSLAKTYLGGAANADMLGPSISDDGSWIAVHSVATNLVPDDLNGKSDVFAIPRP